MKKSRPYAFYTFICLFKNFIDIDLDLVRCTKYKTTDTGKIRVMGKKQNTDINAYLKTIRRHRHGSIGRCTKYKTLDTGENRVMKRKQNTDINAYLKTIRRHRHGNVGDMCKIQDDGHRVMGRTQNTSQVIPALNQ